MTSTTTTTTVFLPGWGSHCGVPAATAAASPHPSWAPAGPFFRVCYPAAGQPDLDALAQDAWAQVDAAGLPGPYLLVGYSLGGMVLQRMVQQGGRTGPVVGCVFLATGSPTLADVAEGCMFPELKSPPARPAMTHVTHVAVTGYDLATLEAVAQFVGANTVRPFTTQLPALVVHGGRDDVLSAKLGERLASRLPGATLVLLPQAGHALLEEVPHLVGALLRRWQRDRHA